MRTGTAIFHRSKHLGDGQLRPPHAACGFCSSEKRVPVCILQKSPEVSLQKCGNCGAASASRLPTKEALDDYYQDYYTSRSLPTTAQRVTFDDAARFGAHLARIAAAHMKPSSLRILDFGGGDGSIALSTAQQLLQRGFPRAHITVVDYNTTLAEPNDARISLVRRDTLDSLSPKDFDLVIASAVIEHVPEPLPTLAALLNLLRRGGVFYARTPYVVPLMKLFGGLRMEWDFTFPAHIHDLGQDFWETFFGKLISPELYTLLESRPSIVETSLSDHFLMTLAAYTLKAPWHLLGRRYTLVGGWEIFARRESAATIGPSIGASAR